jgi:hypothetical protein
MRRRVRTASRPPRNADGTHPSSCECIYALLRGAPGARAPEEARPSRDASTGCGRPGSRSRRHLRARSSPPENSDCLCRKGTARRSPQWTCTSCGRRLRDTHTAGRTLRCRSHRATARLFPRLPRSRARSGRFASHHAPAALAERPLGRRGSVAPSGSPEHPIPASLVERIVKAVRSRTALLFDSRL